MDLPTAVKQQRFSSRTQVAKCLGVNVTELAKPPAGYTSSSFSDSNSNSASNDAGYRATAADQKSLFAIWSGSKMPGCLKDALSTVINDEISHPSSSSNTLPPDAKIGTPTVAQMSFPTYGDQSIAYQVSLPITYMGLSPTVYLDLVIAIKGRADVLMQFESVFTPFAVDQAQHYTGLVVNRLTSTS
jgi:hypothetical protein